MTPRPKVPIARLALSLAMLATAWSCKKERPQPLTIEKDRQRVLALLGDRAKAVSSPEAKRLAQSLRSRAYLANRDVDKLDGMINEALKSRDRRTKHQAAIRKTMALSPTAVVDDRTIDESIASEEREAYNEAIHRTIRSPKEDDLGPERDWKIDEGKCTSVGCFLDQTFPSDHAAALAERELLRDPPGLWSDWPGTMYRSGVFKKDGDSSHRHVTWVVFFTAKPRQEGSR
jgi:hypothetical protein